MAAGAQRRKKAIDLNAQPPSDPPDGAAGEAPRSLDAEWVSRALAGDGGAFDSLYNAHARRVKVYFLRSGFGPAEADDLTQDTFIRVYRSLRTFDPRRGRFSLWVSTIAKNVARRRWSRRKQADNLDPELAEDVVAGGENPRTEASAREEVEAVQDCISRLEPELQEVVRLRYVRGLTTRGIGEQLDMPEATVRLRLKEAQGRLQHCLQAKGVMQ